ncbi:hypothetical protein DFJ74DRAFT_365394, partial [Hyaloraphidium curvatum]
RVAGAVGVRPRSASPAASHTASRHAPAIPYNSSRRRGGIVRASGRLAAEFGPVVGEALGQLPRKRASPEGWTAPGLRPTGFTLPFSRRRLQVDIAGDRWRDASPRETEGRRPAGDRVANKMCRAGVPRLRVLLAAAAAAAAALLLLGASPSGRFPTVAPPPFRVDAADPASWHNVSVPEFDAAAPLPPEWPYPPPPLPHPIPPRCTLIAHLCSTGRAAHSNQALGLARLLWVAHKILNCRVARPYFCQWPEWTRGAVDPDELYDVDWALLGGVPGFAELGPPELDARMEEPAGLPRLEVPCLVDAFSLGRGREPPEHYPSRPFRCAAVTPIDPPRTNHGSLRGTFGVPFPFRLPAWLRPPVLNAAGGEFVMLGEEAARILKPKEWLVDRAKRVLAAVMLHPEGPGAWSKGGPAALPSPAPEFSEAALPRYLSAHVRSADFEQTCEATRKAVGKDKPGCGVDLAALGAFLAAEARAHFRRGERAVLLIGGDAPRSTWDLLRADLARLLPPDPPPGVLFLPRLRSHPLLSPIFSSPPPTAPTNMTTDAAIQRDHAAASVLDQLLLGCGARLVATRRSTFSQRAREVGWAACPGRMLWTVEGWGYLPAPENG